MSNVLISQKAIEDEVMNLLRLRDRESMVTDKECMELHIEDCGYDPKKVIESLKAQGKIKELTQTLIIPV